MAVLTDKTLLYLFRKIAGYADEYAGYQTDGQETEFADSDIRQDAVDMGKDFQRILDHASWAIREFEADALQELKEIDERIYRGVSRPDE